MQLFCRFVFITSIIIIWWAKKCNQIKSAIEIRSSKIAQAPEKVYSIDRNATTNKQNKPFQMSTDEFWTFKNRALKIELSNKYSNEMMFTENFYEMWKKIHTKEGSPFISFLFFSISIRLNEMKRHFEWRKEEGTSDFISLADCANEKLLLNVCACVSSIRGSFANIFSVIVCFTFYFNSLPEKKRKK